MINLDNIKIKEYLRKDGYVDKIKTFKCECLQCGKNKNYQTKSRYLSKPLCIKCSTNTEKHKKQLSESHWSKGDMTPWNKGNKHPDTELRVKIGVNLRSRLNKAIKGQYKSGSAVRDLGCSIEDFKEYMENKFKPNMTWNNWSRDGWHIDHIKPLSKFDLTNYSELKNACHYTNLQPLWAKENLIKSNN